MQLNKTHSGTGSINSWNRLVTCCCTRSITLALYSYEEMCIVLLQAVKQVNFAGKCCTCTPRVVNLADGNYDYYRTQTRNADLYLNKCRALSAHLYSCHFNLSGYKCTFTVSLYILFMLINMCLFILSSLWVQATTFIQISNKFLLYCRWVVWLSSRIIVVDLSMNMMQIAILLKIQLFKWAVLKMCYHRKSDTIHVFHLFVAWCSAGRKADLIITSLPSLLAISC